MALKDDLLKGIPSFDYKSGNPEIDKFGKSETSELKELPGTQYKFKVWDGDSLVLKKGGEDEFQTRMQYIDARETAHGQKPSDPYANIQARSLEIILENAIRMGATFELPVQAIDKTTNQRPVHRILIKKDGETVDVTALLLEKGIVELNKAVYQKQPDLSIEYPYNKLKELEAQAKIKGSGSKNIHSPIVQFELVVDKLEKQNQASKAIRNKKHNQKQYILDEKENINKIKIGDVWLDVPPTHVNISQLRASTSIPILGGESKPLVASLTNRIAIRLNLIFDGEVRVNEDLRRIILQFKYCPINIIRSKDLFQKLSSENNWLKNAYGTTGMYAIPVTMDEYTLYTISGHPGAIGCSLQFSLFNFSPFFLQNVRDRLQYYKYIPEFYEDIEKAGKPIKEKKHNDKFNEVAKNILSQTTINLEESVHPYNWIVQYEIDKTDNRYKGSKEFADGSEIYIGKVDHTRSMKEYELYNPSEVPDPIKLLQVVASSTVKDIAHSISVSSSNNFAWQPLLGFNQPIAQFLGPGETKVSLNIITDNKDTISNILKTFHEKQGPDTNGFYDDRFLVYTPLLDFIDCNILSLQNVVITNIDNKPDHSDINLTFIKSQYDSYISMGELPVEHDNYWGLGRIYGALEESEISKILDDAKTTREKYSLLHKVRNPRNINIDSVDTGFCAGINKILSFIKGLHFDDRQDKKAGGKVLDGDEIFSRLEISSISGSQMEQSIIDNIDKLGKDNTFIKIADGTSVYNNDAWKKDKSFLSNIKLENGKSFDSLGIGNKFDFLNLPVLRSDRKIQEGKVEEIIQALGKNKNFISSKHRVVFLINNTNKEEYEILKNIFSGKSDYYERYTNIDNKKLPRYNTIASDIINGSGKIVIHSNGVANPIYEKKEVSKIEEIDKAQHIAMQKALEKAKKEGLFISKPKAAHRYMQGIDEFVSESNIFSKTMGYWFTFDNVLNVGLHIQKMRDFSAECTNPLKNTDAWKAVYEQDLGMERIAKYIEDNKQNPTSVLVAAISNRDLSDPSSYDANKRYVGRSGGLINNIVKDLSASDYPFDSFSDLLLAEDFFDKNSDMHKAVVAYINKEDSRAKYYETIDSSTKDNINKTFDRSVGKSIKYIDTDTVQDPSLTTIKDISIISNTNKLTDPYSSQRKNMAKLQASNVSDDIGIIGHAFDEFNINADEQEQIDKFKETQEKRQKIDAFVNSQFQNQSNTFGMQNAFPTYKLYIIYDDTSDYKYKSLDDYWDFRLVQDLMVVRDKNNPAHILKCRVVVDPRYITTNGYVNQRLGREKPVEFKNQIGRNKDTSAEYVLSQGRSPLRQGMRICLKLGYHTDPRLLDTVFIGTIASLQGDQLSGIYEIEAQGDGRELTIPPTISNQTLKGNSFQEIISTILRTSPNVVHFGKCYGSWLERLSRRHQVVFTYLKSELSSLSLFGGGLGLMVGGGWMTRASLLSLKSVSYTLGPAVFKQAAKIGIGAAITGAGAGSTLTGLVTSDNRNPFSMAGVIFDASRYSAAKADIFTSTGLWWGDLFKGLVGNTFNAEKAGYQVAKHFASTFEAGNNPVDDNIWAQDIHAGRDSINININNQTSIWDILVRIKRMYPNHALDIRPYGSRSTLYLGPTNFWYWRTDDPLLAMAPSLTAIDGLKDSSQFDNALADGIKNINGLNRDYRGNITPDSLDKGGIAPFIPFKKTHIVSTKDDIIYNGIKGTPDRGWNAVVVNYAGGKEPLDFVADMDLYPGAIRRKFENLDWISDERLARQYALGLLKEGVERLYGGILIVKGNPKIEPYDNIHIIDDINKMFGTVQVETVIHKFDSEFGFTTHIVPNMRCSINNTSYSSGLDIAKKEFFYRLGNIGYDDVAMLALGAGLAFTGLGFFATAFLQLGASWATGLILNKIRNDSNDIKIELGAIKESDRDLLYWANKAEMMKDIQVYEKEALTAWAIAHLGKFIKKGEYKTWFNDISKDSISAASRAFFDKAGDKAKQLWNFLGDSKNGILASGSVKANIYKYGGKDVKDISKLFDDLSSKDDIAKQKAKNMLKDIWDDTKFQEAIKDKKLKITNADELFDQLEKNSKLKTKFTDGFKSYKEKASEYAKTKATGKNFLKGTNLLFGGLTFAAFQGIPYLFDTLTIKATTKGQCITVHPLWHKESLLMPGLDGYKNNDIFAHYKDQIISAKETVKEVWHDLKYHDTISFIGQNFKTVSTEEDAPQNNKPVKMSIDNILKSPIFLSLQDRIAELVNHYSKIHNVKNLSVSLVNAIIMTESTFDHTSVSKAGAIGFMQLMPATAKELKVDPFSKDDNIRGGISFMAQLLQKYNDNIEQALAYYNGGHGGVKSWISQIFSSGYKETKEYIPKVLKYKELFEQKHIRENSAYAVLRY